MVEGIADVVDVVDVIVVETREENAIVWKTLDMKWRLLLLIVGICKQTALANGGLNCWLFVNEHRRLELIYKFRHVRLGVLLHHSPLRLHRCHVLERTAHE
jgi:hypothetical protein